MKWKFRREVYNLLDRVYLDNLGECLVFLWSEEIRTFLQEYKMVDDIDLLLFVTQFL